MTTTTNLGLTQLEVGQTAKEATINGNNTLLDSKVTLFLGDAASDPSTSGIPLGSTYYNTGSSKLKVLRASGWTNVA